MKNLAFAIALLATITGHCQMTQIELVSNIWPPFTNNPGETAVATEIVKAALNRNSIATTERILDFEMVIKGLEKGAFQSSPALWKTPKREASLLFSKPILYNQLVLVGLKGADVGATSFAELHGKKIGVVEGYAYGVGVNQAQGVEIVKGKSDQANLIALLGKRVDYIFVDALLIAYLRSYQPEDAKKHLEIGKTPLVTKSLHFAVQREMEGAEGLVARFDSTITEMKIDGTYHRILRLSWIHDDVDGDGELEMIPGANAGRMTDDTYSLNGGSSMTGRIYYNGKHMEWEELPEDIKRTGINEREVRDFTFLSFEL